MSEGAAEGAACRNPVVSRVLRGAQGVPDAPRPAWCRLRGLDTRLPSRGAGAATARRTSPTVTGGDGSVRDSSCRVSGPVTGVAGDSSVGNSKETGGQFPYLMPPVFGTSIPWVPPRHGPDGPARDLVRRRLRVRAGPSRLSTRGAQSLPGDIPGTPGSAVLRVGTRRRDLTDLLVGHVRRRGLSDLAPDRLRRAPQGRTSRVSRPGFTRLAVDRAGCPGRLLGRALPRRPQRPARGVGGPVRIGLAGQGTPSRHRLLPHRAVPFPSLPVLLRRHHTAPRRETRSDSARSVSSVKDDSPEVRIASARARLDSSISAMRSSTVPSVIRRCTWTGWVWPMR